MEKIIINKTLTTANTYPVILVLNNNDPDEKKDIVNKIALVIRNE
jgi:hypothetical protein